MLKETFAELARHIASDSPVALATVVAAQSQEEAEGPLPLVGASMLVRTDGTCVGSLGEPHLDGSVARDALGQIDAGTTGTRHYGPTGEARRQDVSVFIEAFAPPPRMVIFGAVDFSAALARVAKVLGYHVTVCDARAVFATSDRFPMADEVVVDWPDRHLAKVGASLKARDAVCVLTHDPKFDVPAIMAALGTKAGYIGAMGSRRTTAEREERLREAGADDAALDRVMAPMGLDISARTPEETAVSICAEIVALRSGGSGSGQLRSSDGPIHRHRGEPAVEEGAGT
jgi:xanthine dehydrogenase accessory factor